MTNIKAAHFPRAQRAHKMIPMEVIHSENTIPFKRKRKKHFVRWERVIVTLALLVSVAFIVQRPPAAPAYKADTQATRRIKAIEEYNKLAAAKFKNDCWMNQKLKLPISPACMEVLQ